MLRDFIYLDPERVRSFAAQLMEGVPEGREATRDHEAGATAGAGGSLFGLVKADGEASYLYRRSSTETRSLHHHVYSLLEDEIEKTVGITDVDSDFDFARNWTPTAFEDGEFVRVRGNVRIVDFERTVDAITGFPKMFAAFQSIQEANIAKRQRDGEITAAEAQQQKTALRTQSNEMKAIPTKDIGEFAKRLVSTESIRIKVQPDGAPFGYLLAGVGAASNVIDTSLFAGAVNSPDSTPWVVVGQVSPSTSTNAFHPMPTGNQFEDQLEEVSKALASMTKTGADAVFPALKFTPLAIYREIRESD